MNSFRMWEILATGNFLSLGLQHRQGDIYVPETWRRTGRVFYKFRTQITSRCTRHSYPPPWASFSVWANGSSSCNGCSAHCHRIYSYTGGGSLLIDRRPNRSCIVLPETYQRHHIRSRPLPLLRSLRLLRSSGRSASWWENHLLNRYWQR